MSSNNPFVPFGQFVDVDDSELGTDDTVRHDELSEEQQQQQLAKVQQAVAKHREQQKILEVAKQKVSALSLIHI